VQLVTEVGHQLGLSVVAEGVENDGQVAALREIGCDHLQGFLISRPSDTEEISTRVRLSGVGVSSAAWSARH
jgi:EAL domain-containing protein (putative c-di-GMP-specific phosphodiesterase class I)